MTDLRDQLEQRVQNFIQDRYVWETFVADNFELFLDKKNDTDFAERYRALIDKYCAAGKVHQGLALSSVVDHTPAEEHIVKFECSDNRAIVFTEIRHTSESRLGWISPHEFEFKKSGNDWFLEEVYFNDGSGRYECL